MSFNHFNVTPILSIGILILILSGCTCDPDCKFCYIKDVNNCSCIINPDYDGKCIHGTFDFEECTCKCYGGWTDDPFVLSPGTHCDYCDLNTFSNPCGAGTLSFDADSCKCKCKPGWYGLHCDSTGPAVPGAGFSFEYIKDGLNLGTFSTDSIVVHDLTPSKVWFSSLIFGDTLIIEFIIFESGNPLAEQTYTFSNNLNNTFIELDIDTGVTIQYLTSSGTATIDTLSANYVSGTFEAELYNTGGNSTIVNMSNGTFWIRE